MLARLQHYPGLVPLDSFLLVLLSACQLGRGARVRSPTVFSVKAIDQTLSNPFVKSSNGNPVRLTFDSKLECAFACTGDAVCSGFAFKPNGTSVDCVFSQRLQNVSSSPGWILHVKARGKGTYRGCYEDGYSRFFAGYGAANYIMPMTVRACVDHCIAAGHSLAAPENGDQCYCGSGFVYQPPKLLHSRCNAPCRSDSSQFCGGPDWAAAIYETGL